jgi:hypothetical protein
MNILFRFACPTNIACGLTDAACEAGAKNRPIDFQFYLRDVEAV